MNTSIFLWYLLLVYFKYLTPADPSEVLNSFKLYSNSYNNDLMTVIVVPVNI